MVALYCDLRLASDAAVFTTAFARRGLVAEHGISWMLPRLVGLPHALDLLLSARKIDAAEALRMGLVSQVLPGADFAAGVTAYARELADLVSPRSMQVMKRQLWEAQFQDLGRGHRGRRDRDAALLRERGLPRGRGPLPGEARAPRFTGR